MYLSQRNIGSSIAVSRFYIRYIPSSVKRRYNSIAKMLKIKKLGSYFNKILMNPFGIIFPSQIKYRRGYNSSNRIIKLKIFK